MDEQSKKIDSRPEESSSQPSVLDAKPDETTSTVESSGLAPGSSTAHLSSELQDKVSNSVVLDVGSSDASSNVVMTHEVSQEVETPAATKDEVVPSLLNGEFSNENVSLIPSMVPSSESANPGTELGLDNHSIGPGENIGLKDPDDSVKPGEEKSHSVHDDAPSPVTIDGKKSKPLDSTADAISNVTKQESEKEKTSLNKVQEQLEEVK